MSGKARGTSVQLASATPAGTFRYVAHSLDTLWVLRTFPGGTVFSLHSWPMRPNVDHSTHDLGLGLGNSPWEMNATPMKPAESPSMAPEQPRQETSPMNGTAGIADQSGPVPCHPSAAGPGMSEGHLAGKLIALLFILLVLLLGMGAAGCVQTKMTEPPRAAVEQLLLSTAADRSLASANFQNTFQDKKVFMDPAYFESYDKPYVLGAIRDTLSSHGALLVADVKDAEIIVEPRSGALSTDSTSSEVGIPAMGIPVPLSGTFSTPDLYIFKSQKQFSTAKIALLAYDAKSRQHLYSSGPLVGRAHQNYYSFLLFIKLTRTDIPEKKKK